MTDFEEDEKEFENTRSVAKEDKDEQGKEEKGVVKFFEVGTDEENNSDIVFNDVGGIVYGKGNDTWADAGLKHGSYFLLDRIPEDGWYFHDESRLSKEPLCRSNLEVHLQFHVDRLETGSQVKTWDPGIKFVRSNTLRTSLETTMMSKKMAELEDDFREFKAHTERRFVSLDMSIRAYRLEEDQRHEEEDQRHEERIRRYDELKNLLLSLIQKSSSPVQSSRPITTKVPTKPTECASSYGDFGCLSPNNMTDFEEDEKVFENTRSVTKEDKDEQGKEEKGVVNYFEVGTDEQDNSRSVLNDVGGIVYGKGNNTWADAGLKHGSYLLLDVIPEDDWYFLDESGLSKEPVCRSNLNVHLQFHVDRLETGSQVKTWDPRIKFVRSNTLRTRSLFSTWQSYFSHLTKTARLRAMLTITLSELMSDAQVTQMKSDGKLEEKVILSIKIPKLLQALFSK
ncbi:hypothetical protein Tco_0173225 [Tanacetum coccineum]